MTAYRLFIKRGNKKRNILATTIPDPAPRKGDKITLEGADWIVEKIAPEKVIAVFKKIGDRLEQVFP